MESRLRLGFAALALLVAGTMFTPTFFVPAFAAAATRADATDPSGDTVTETVEDPISTPAADIVATRRGFTTGGGHPRRPGGRAGRPRRRRELARAASPA